MSLYSQPQIESVITGSTANLYQKVRALYVSFEEFIDIKAVSAFYSTAIKQNILLSVLSDNLSSSDVKQGMVYELNAMGVTKPETSFYFSPGYTNNDYAF